MKREILVLIMAGCFLMKGYAQTTPLKMASDKRISVIAYSPNNVIPIHGRTFTTTQITFGKYEYIKNVQNGDLGAWTASISSALPNMLFIKPTVYDSQTNMTVVTNQHTYYFYLTSNKESEKDASDATFAVHFIYPEERRKAIERRILARQRQKQAELSAFKNPRDYHWDYSYEGDTTILPAHVFDDGKVTYLQLRPHQPIPSIFAIHNAKGKESLVNFRRDGNYLVILQTAPQFTLRMGKDHVLSLFNNCVIKRIQKTEWVNE